MTTVSWRSNNMPVDRDVIRHYGEIIDAKLPEEYINLVTTNDGGKPRPNCFDMEERKEAVFNNLLAFNPKVGQDIFGIYELIKNNTGESKILPFGRDPFGNFICFDFRKNLSNPGIVFFDHEADPDVHEEIFKYVNSDFNNFIDSLYEPVD
jgi:hypothetical protein